MRQFFILSILLCFFTLPFDLVAQQYSPKQMEKFSKSAENESKKIVKNLEKEKWIFNGVGTLEGAYARYLMQGKDFGGTADLATYEINNAPNLRNGEKSLMNQAQSSYAQENEAYLISEQKAHSGEVDITLEDNVIKALAQFNGDVKRSFVIHRKNQDGTYDMRGYFIIDSNATKAKLQKLAKNLSDEHSMGDEIKKRVIDNE